MKHTKKSFTAVLATVMLLSNSVFAHTEHDENESNDTHTAQFENARTEQNNFFQQMREDIANGIPVDVAGASCKYISSIFQPAPAKTVMLTFDDGPSSKFTPVVLDVLKKYNLKATFFMKGSNAAKHPKIVQRVVDEGHIVANHSYSHPNFHELSQSQQTNEMTTSDGILSPYMPRNVKLFRYPYGNSTCSTNTLAHKMGYKGIVGWHVDSCDWAYQAAFANNRSVSSSQIRICEIAPKNIENYVGHVTTEIKRYNGGVVLMHDVHEQTALTLEEVIVRLIRDGYTFGTLDEERMSAYMR